MCGRCLQHERSYNCRDRYPRSRVHALSNSTGRAKPQSPCSRVSCHLIRTPHVRMSTPTARICRAGPLRRSPPFVPHVATTRVAGNVAIRRSTLSHESPWFGHCVLELARAYWRETSEKRELQALDANVLRRVVLGLPGGASDRPQGDRRSVTGRPERLPIIGRSIRRADRSQLGAIKRLREAQRAPSATTRAGSSPGCTKRAPDASAEWRRAQGLLGHGPVSDAVTCRS